MSKRIAVLTSGGDTPGMNAAISAVCEKVEDHGGHPVAVRYGFEGLAQRELSPLTAKQARTQEWRTSTWLGSSRWTGMTRVTGIVACRRALADFAIDGLVVLGGDGSLQASRRLVADQSPVAFVPCTIDNDIDGSARTIGMDSAIEYAVGVIERLRCTGRSLLGRGFVVETLGGPTGHLALAVAARAQVADVLIPERRLELGVVARSFDDLAAVGDAIAVVSEGYGDAVSIARELTRLSAVRVRPTILGHAQRAADVTSVDWGLAFNAGGAAVEALLDGASVSVCIQKDGSVAPVPFDDVGDRIESATVPYYDQELA